MGPTMDTRLLRTDGKNSNVRRNILNETTAGRPEVSGRNKQQNPHQKQAYPPPPLHPERTGCKNTDTPDADTRLFPQEEKAHTPKGEGDICFPACQKNGPLHRKN